MASKLLKLEELKEGKYEGALRRGGRQQGGRRLQNRRLHKRKVAGGERRKGDRPVAPKLRRRGAGLAFFLI